MKENILKVLGVFLVLSASTYVKGHQVEVKFGHTATFQCQNTNHHIVVDSVYLNGNKDDNGRYHVKMACDTEPSCEFQFSQDIFMGVALPAESYLVIIYSCKQFVRQASSKRIQSTTRITCPQETFVQKHIGYFKDSNIAPEKDSAEVRRKWEIIAMAVASQAQRFRLTNRADRLRDPTVYTVFLIHNSETGDFQLRRPNCELTNRAVRRSIKYQCNRFTNPKKWTCNFVSKQVDKAAHDSITGHYYT
nr:uncharacterized protein LOC108119221 [Drosophila bipectinata]